jgi:hypothetical protein
VSDFPLVEVSWNDAAAETEEHDILNLPQLIPALTVGYLVQRTDEAVWVAGEMLRVNDKGKTGFRGTTVIPASWVVRIRRVEPAPAKRKVKK